MPRNMRLFILCYLSFSVNHLGIFAYDIGNMMRPFLRYVMDELSIISRFGVIHLVIFIWDISNMISPNSYFGAGRYNSRESITCILNIGYCKSRMQSFGRDSERRRSGRRVCKTRHLHLVRMRGRYPFSCHVW